MVKNYHKTSKDLWTGRIDDDKNRKAFRWHQVIQCYDIESLPQTSDLETVYGILGFLCDEGVRRNQGRVGAKDGPNAIRKSLANLPVHFPQSLHVWDVGNIVCEDNDLETAQEALSEAVCLLLEAGIQPLVLGGGHEVALGHGRGLYRFFPGKKLGIINFDAHFDLRPLVQKQGSSGTPFLQLSQEQKEFHYCCLGIQPFSNTASLFEKADELNVTYFLREQLYNDPKTVSKMLQQFISDKDGIYLTVCLDVFLASLAPGVSAPAVKGIDFGEFNLFFDPILKSGKLMSMDVAEMNPIYDKEGITARLAAEIIAQSLI